MSTNLGDIAKAFLREAITSTILRIEERMATCSRLAADEKLTRIKDYFEKNADQYKIAIKELREWKL